MNQKTNFPQFPTYACEGDRIDALTAERDQLAELADRLPVRYFMTNYDLEDGPDIVECDEYEFMKAPGRIEYERHIVRENGVNQICLTKVDA